MSVSKSCKAIVSGMPVEIVVLDAAGDAYDFCQEHNTFAVSPGQFSVRATLATDVKSLRRYNVQRGDCVRFTLSMDGHFVAAKCPSLAGPQASCIFEDKLVDKTGKLYKHALELAKPQAGAHGASGKAAAGDLGTINIAISQVNVTRSNTLNFGGPVASRAGSSRGGKKFFMEQGVTFKTGQVKGPHHGPTVTSHSVSGGFNGSISMKYDMTEYLRLRGVLPGDFPALDNLAADDSAPAHPEAGDSRIPPADAMAIVPRQEVEVVSNAMAIVPRQEVEVIDLQEVEVVPEQEVGLNLKHEVEVVDLTHLGSVSGPCHGSALARNMGPIDLTDA